MLTMDRMSSEREGRIEIYNSPYSIIMLREKGGSKIIGIMKPKDGEMYKARDSHSLCYRKYIVQTSDYEREMFEAICKGEFHYMPFLSDATIIYETGDEGEVESNDNRANTEDSVP